MKAIAMKDTAGFVRHLGCFAVLASVCAAAACARPCDAPTTPESNTAAQGRAESPATMPDHYDNPVITGTNPDPSACRVGDDYYLVSSSFEYFPGVPLYHSRDLVHWEQLGHVLTRESQLALKGVASSKGIFAPTLRHHDGTFYMITTNMEGGGSFYVTAKAPGGPWSEPIWIDESVFTMDPSLFFDDDGRVYYTRHGEGRNGGVFQAELDIATGKLLAPPKKIWAGTGDVWPEGPHLYKVDGSYYLMISEGGTSFDHKVTIARSSSPWGPFEPNPENPILTHRYLPNHPFQAMGHADLLDTPDGNYFIVFLGVRPSTPQRHQLGRETFLAPVQWSQGWPVVNGKQPIDAQLPTTGLPAWTPTPKPPVRDDLSGPELALSWKFVRNPRPESYSLAERPGFLRLKGSSASIDEVSSSALVVRPQRHHRMRMATELHFKPAPGQRAGLVIRGNEKNHFDLLVEGDGATNSVVFTTTIHGEKREVGRAPVEGDRVRLAVDGYPDHYTFFVENPKGGRTLLGSASTIYFAYEETGSFTGAYVGVYAHSTSDAEAVADFAWFDYEGL